MGRYNFKPLRVYQATSQLLSSGRIQHQPAWFATVGNIPPAQILVRTLPVDQTNSRARRRHTKKPSRMFAPQRIMYDEDRLRRDFFEDHPWELARPRVVLENDGKDAQRYDWSNIRQPGKALDGERFAAKVLLFRLISDLSQRSTTTNVASQQ